MTDIAAEVDRLRAAGLEFRNDIVKGPGGSQILVDDPSGNAIELFEPRWPRTCYCAREKALRYPEGLSIQALRHAGVRIVATGQTPQIA